MSVSGLRTAGAVLGVAVVTAGISVGIATVRAHVGAGRADPVVATAADADDDPTSLVETFDYPGADAIQEQDSRVVLLRGDGHIVYDATCATPAAGVGQIKVRPQPDDTPICFNVLGSSGWLSMHIDDVFEIDGRKATTADGQTASATVQQKDQSEETVPLAKTAVTPIGIKDGTSVPTVLLNLAVNAA